MEESSDSGRVGRHEMMYLADIERVRPLLKALLHSQGTPTALSLVSLLGRAQFIFMN